MCHVFVCLVAIIHTYLIDLETLNAGVGDWVTERPSVWYGRVGRRHSNPLV